MMKIDSLFSYNYLFAALSLLFLWGCKEEQTPTLFEKLPASYTGITFQNHVEENDSMNMMTFTNFYTGAGVGVGDIIFWWLYEFGSTVPQQR